MTSGRIVQYWYADYVIFPNIWVPCSDHLYPGKGLDSISIYSSKPANIFREWCDSHNSIYKVYDNKSATMLKSSRFYMHKPYSDVFFSL